MSNSTKIKKVMLVVTVAALGLFLTSSLQERSSKQDEAMIKLSKATPVEIDCVGPAIILEKPEPIVIDPFDDTSITSGGEGSAQLVNIPTEAERPVISTPEPCDDPSWYGEAGGFE